MSRPAFLRRLSIRNFKSIGVCDVELGPVTVLVGRNGAGKSNVLDSLRFVVDGLETSLDYAIRSRGGTEEVRRRGHQRNLAIRLHFDIDETTPASYGFELTVRKNGTFAVKREQLVIESHSQQTYFEREESLPISAVIAFDRNPILPPVVEDRLYLVNAAGLPAFRPAYDALLAMGFYNLNPTAMKELHSTDAGELLQSDGANIASVVARLTTKNPEVMGRITQYLASIAPGVEKVARQGLGPKETLEFSQRIEGTQNPWHFYAANMSDGTLRALGALVAVNQITSSDDFIRLAGIEEPETALHPGAAGALMDALREASARTQIIATTHSADLLDQLDMEADSLLVVAAREGTSRIAAADAASRQAIREHLYSPGDLLRMDQLQPDEADVRRQEQISLFEPVFAL